MQVVDKLMMPGMVVSDVHRTEPWADFGGAGFPDVDQGAAAVVGSGPARSRRSSMAGGALELRPVWRASSVGEARRLRKSRPRHSILFNKI